VEENMSRFALIAALLAVAAVSSNAQFEEPKYDAGAVSTLVDRVHTDLNHAYGLYHFSNDDRDRLNHAEKELRDFSEKWDHGKFDKGQLNGSIDSVQRVLDKNRMPPEARDSISEDVSQLRKMREAWEHHQIQ
jgi:hypothetical protein